MYGLRSFQRSSGALGGRTVDSAVERQRLIERQDRLHPRPAPFAPDTRWYGSQARTIDPVGARWKRCTGTQLCSRRPKVDARHRVPRSLEGRRSRLERTCRLKSMLGRSASPNATHFGPNHRLRGHSRPLATRASISEARNPVASGELVVEDPYPSTIDLNLQSGARHLSRDPPFSAAAPVQRGAWWTIF